MKEIKIATVILNFNSNNDLFTCVEQIIKQKKINNTIIIVDNFSSDHCVEEIKQWKNKNHPNAICDGPQIINNKIIEDIKTNLYIIYNKENKGYSAGNNIGIELANLLGCGMVFISNPDMRFNDSLYISKLAGVMASDTKNYVVASRVIGLDGLDQSPMRESTFMEELLWPKQLFPKLFKTPNYIIKIAKTKPVSVPKIMGCALLIYMPFLKKIGYMDDNVFLYSEEAILSSQVKRNGGRIMFVPTVKSIHAHKKSAKGSSSLRMLYFIKSRKYFINKYSEYTFFQKSLLHLSYSVLFISYYIKSFWLKK